MLEIIIVAGLALVAVVFIAFIIYLARLDMKDEADVIRRKGVMDKRRGGR